ncbi:MAG TPA: SDR family oxidoreductase, partial [Kineosporiaceae bacterium]|nr:SDR family oxidoreductase [Kineosporiaceae bacterium]
AAAAVIGGGEPLWQTPPAVRDAIWAVDVAGVWNLAAAAVPAMLRRPVPRTGRFVAVASSAAERGLLHLSAYCAAKHAVVGLVRALAHDLRGSGVNAGAVSPGSMDTAMLHATAALYGLSDVAPLADGMPLGRILEPAEVAAAVCWMCGPESVAITGSVLHADGGFTA